MGRQEQEPNNLLDFMLRIGERTPHVLPGTATPIQTEVRELWDLLRVLDTSAEFARGRETSGHWVNVARAVPLVKGEKALPDEREALEWTRNPLPPASEHEAFTRPR